MTEGTAGLPVSLRERLETSGRPVPMPAANLPMISALLARRSNGSSRSVVVEFPPGFSQQEPGRFAVAEEFVVLSGSLKFSGENLTAGHHMWVPANHMRYSLASEDGALVFAWFSGRPILKLESPEPNEPRTWTHTDLTRAAPGALRRDMGDGLGGSCWRFRSTRATDGADLIDIDAATWSDAAHPGGISSDRVFCRWD